MKIIDKVYPTIGITTKASILENEKGYRWRIEMHIAGPDDFLYREGATFDSKARCTEDLLYRFNSVSSEMFKEICS